MELELHVLTKKSKYPCPRHPFSCMLCTLSMQFLGNHYTMQASVYTRLVSGNHLNYLLVLWCSPVKFLGITAQLSCLPIPCIKTSHTMYTIIALQKRRNSGNINCTCECMKSMHLRHTLTVNLLQVKYSTDQHDT